MTAKSCFKCGVVKPLNEFYRHSAMGDGHLGKCKACTKRDVMHHRAENIDRVRRYDRERAKLPHVKARINRVVEAWTKANPQKHRAQQLVMLAIRRGELIRPSTCSSCGVLGKIEAHHPDYSQPMFIEWLCKPCHARADVQRRAVA